jgi:hypothetical protein
MSPLLSKKRSHHESSEPPKPMRELMSPQFAIVNAIPAKNHNEEQQHPHLENLYVMCRRERIPPNAIDIDIYSGWKILIIRTPDDDEDADDGDDDDYFRGKQRQFEFQWQLRLKKLVPGDVYVGMEVDEPIQMGLMQRALANVALKFTKKTKQVRCTGGNETLSLPSSCRVSPTVYQIQLTKVSRDCPFLLKHPWIDSMPPN